MITKYEHHGKTVSVQEHLKGKHREHCLCYQNCKFFHPEDQTINCVIASSLFEVCRAFAVTTPVWECKEYEPRTVSG